MSGSSQSVRVNIFGDEYSVKSDVNSQTIKEVADYVNKKMVEIKQGTASSDRVKVAILTALNIAGELFESRSKHQACEEQVKEFQSALGSLTRKLDQAV